ncbi:MAG: GNAT family N-acetyltransferase [Calditrichota bacterium]
MAIKISPVDTKDDLKEFIRFPYRLHRGQPGWTPPLISEVKGILDQKRNPFFQHASMQSYLARVNGRVVGRIAAIVDQNYIKVRREMIGLFGFFESVNDLNVAVALFNTASKWLREENMKKMLGPASPSMNDEIGVLQDAFDLPPAIKMVWNPSYYPALYENAGFEKAMDVFAWTMSQDEATERFLRGGELVLKRSRLTFRNPDMKNFDAELKIFRRIYNEAWSENWGFVPWTEAEFEHIAKSIKQVIDPNIVLIAELEGKPVGFSLALPDINFALQHINGRLFPFGLPILLWYSRKIKRLRIVLLGVLKEYRHRGFDTALYYETYRRGTAKGYNSCEMSWILDSNEPMNRMAAMMGAKRYKTYRLYERRV